MQKTLKAMSALAAVMLAACQPSVRTEETEAAAARFEAFYYEGADYSDALAPDEYRNPILSGFYPDPSIAKAGDEYYLVNSTFSWFPGIPVFKSRDLVNWTQIGNVIDRAGMLDFTDLGVSRGVFAPTIEYHDGVFYVANTCVDCGGNFIVTAEDPAGPWSDPVWLPDIGGIDPSLFFDDDGAVYLMNNDAPPGEAKYDGHRAIWIRKIDPETFQSLEAPTVLIDGGVRPEEKPIWIEGPHIYKIGETYYLSAAEGGTAINHSQVVLRSDHVLGPYEPYEGNPILTQRDLPPDRENAVTSVGHADLVDTGEGGWRAVFLGVRPYEGDYYNTGRETFLLPVEWVGGWPVILPRGAPVPLKAKRPALPPGETPPVPTHGDFSLTENFDEDDLAPYWLSLRGPADEWLSIKDGAAILTAQKDGLGDFGYPAFLARRQQHLNALAETSVVFNPQHPGEEAGLAVFQNDAYFYALGVTLDEDGSRTVRLRRRAGAETPSEGEVVASASLGAPAETPVRLRIRARGDAYDFDYAQEGGAWMSLKQGADGKILSTHVAGGFVGAVFGIYAE
ncbi:glycoside hydrolase family 43 protein [Hyphococcus luteus]|uniref:Glycoside hydrolase 43 family protein n=1 Tax=Hyphococcus luteus TaxID=2058213 RepID=A0A2S7KAG8_9PROT|nr:glycoside hydrolase family 43 protein [Marinicaulis flavus]PQA89510.1 glycoside hydrolase 43 family protein [Marinicaulis flavus]